ncbi:TIR-NBS-LRR disease resistance protein [Quillaja saponaria]|uniref:TIR-NBS-LRR disease resistance protein n=1 Tax=Quillaja saponaria TaxID=32244 RepID=A0AAD7PCM7_QUISA|nr:TIR-NBS-LRR disease resistance protein [Quillaja saponaria]
MASLASSSSQSKWMYDVFLSFRGLDTRKTFTDHLYLALKEAGINTFRDNNEIRRGEDISSDLVKAIQGSRVSVIVFSKNYASSRWCLEELEKIMECRRIVRQLVFPIFYDVDPSDVRKQMGPFEKAFEEHEERFLLDIDKVLNWRRALIEAGNLSGWDLRNTHDGHEAKFIKKIVEEISRELSSTYLFVALYPVGIEPRMQEITSLLCVGSTDVCVVGIWGMGGTGKTTIAKAIYNQLYRSFEGQSFIANIGETWKKDKGSIRLQKQLLSDILKTSKIMVTNIDRGINIIHERLSCRRVLVILDDVDKLDQLNALGRSCGWFGPGSRIIITTRDKHLLDVLKVDKVYMTREMDETESLELFSWHAFRRSYPDEDFFEFSRNIVDYSGGLPLALEVLGSYLFNRSITEWQSALAKLRKIPHDHILTKLKISFDALSDDKIKDVFLDICCYFIGMDKGCVIQILDACGLFAGINISILMERCLVSVNEKNKLMMHDLLRDMGREIVRKISPKEPGSCSRLWDEEDVVEVLTRHTGTKAIEGLGLNLPKSNKMNFNTIAFRKMQKLRLLQLCHVQLTGDYKHFSYGLRWLCWHGFPLKCIPSAFYQGNLVAIDLRYSNLKLVWKDPLLLEKLTILNLSHSQHLIQTPDFSKLPNLEQLILKNCTGLYLVHESIGNLKRLVFLNLRDCKCLRNLPRSFYKLKSLETLILSGCSKIDHLADELGEMESLITLIADNTAIKKVPYTIGRLKNLRYLSLCGCKGSPSKSFPSLLWSWISRRQSPQSPSLLPTSLQGLNSLRSLYLADCNLSDDTIPKDLGSLPSLTDLNLSSNSFTSLPSSLRGLSKLHSLWLDHCVKLRSIPDLPTRLSALYATNCPALETTPNLSEISTLQTLSLTNCHNLVEIPGFEMLNSVRSIQMGGCHKITNTVRDSMLKGWTTIGFGGIFLPGNDIPDWFIYKDDGPSVFFEVPQLNDHILENFRVCIVYSCLDNYMESGDLPSVSVINYTKGTIQTFKPVTPDVVISPEDLLWQSILSNKVFKMEGGDEVEVIVDFGPQFTVKKTGINFVYINSMDGTMIQYPSISHGNAIECIDVEDIDNDGTEITCKRGRESGGGAGPSNSCIDDKDRQSKRMRFLCRFSHC